MNGHNPEKEEGLNDRDSQQTFQTCHCSTFNGNNAKLPRNDVINGHCCAHPKITSLTDTADPTCRCLRLLKFLIFSARAGSIQRPTRQSANGPQQVRKKGSLKAQNGVNM